MKKFILSALALTFMAAPLATAVDASAQTRRDARQELREDRRELRQDRREYRRELREDRREIRRDRRAVARPAWLKRGGKYRNGGQAISDYRRYGLKAPGRGQRWVRYNDDYILVTLTTGLIASIIASR